ISGREAESGNVLDSRQAAGEGGEEEQREEQRRHEQGRVGEGDVKAAPGDAAGDREVPHERAILVRRAIAASVRKTTAITVAMPKPSARASPSQPVMMRLRTHSTR